MAPGKSCDIRLMHDDARFVFADEGWEVAGIGRDDRHAAGHGFKRCVRLKPS